MLTTNIDSLVIEDAILATNASGPTIEAIILATNVGGLITEVIVLATNACGPITKVKIKLNYSRSICFEVKDFPIFRCLFVCKMWSNL